MRFLISEDSCIQYSDTDLVFESFPMRSKLRAVVERFGRPSKELENLCNVVYSSIRGKLSVEHVYAAYQVTDQRNLTFVVTVKSDGDVIDVEKCLKELAIECVIKSPHQTNSDNKETVVPCNLPIQEEDIKKLRNCITTHADQLRANHRYLNMIKGFMHKVNNPSSENKNQYEARLAMFVHAQGYIPIDEEPIKKNIDGIQVDVREGAFMLDSRQPADAVLNDISMGCQISRNKSGTLSLFFEHPDHGLCGITSAHVLLSADELIQCEDKSSHFSVSDSDDENDVQNDVYQPHFSPVRDNVIGKLKEVIYKPLHGLEIAIFSIKKRPPKYGEFPIPRDGTDLGIFYLIFFYNK
ncbi:hypothetical protein DPMN_037661 [Dreissena polymorpha]|uniref:Uncharacterized protein n=1 Tax=Dreissena polymorpha TaxID=45954 RepID=A0A9D4MBD4_DREPO|nr:hypothetical protein DPMN_037661 [Dreissena polymorpha]